MTSTPPVDPAHVEPRKRRPLRLIERLSWSLGIAAIGVWMAATVSGTIGARREVARFGALQAAAVAEAAAPDQSLWSPERVKAWRDSQAQKSPTTLTRRALGAQTANATPGVPSTTRACAPSTWYSR